MSPTVDSEDLEASLADVGANHGLYALWGARWTCPRASSATGQIPDARPGEVPGHPPWACNWPIDNPESGRASC